MYVGMYVYIYIYMIERKTMYYDVCLSVCKRARLLIHKAVYMYV